MTISLTIDKDFVAKHREALRIATLLTTWFRRDHQPTAVNVRADKIIAQLSTVGIRCVLMGTHGLNVYRDQSRATSTVDVLVRRKDFAAAKEIFGEMYAKLRIEQTPTRVRFIERVNDLPALVLTKPALPWQRAVFENMLPIGGTYFVPTLEMAITDKFVSMVSPEANLCSRYQDGADFGNAAMNNRQTLDLPKLQSLVELANPGDGKWIRRIIKDLDADQLHAMTDRIALALKRKAS